MLLTNGGSAVVLSETQASKASAPISVRCFGRVICAKARQCENTCACTILTRVCERSMAINCWHCAKALTYKLSCLRKVDVLNGGSGPGKTYLRQPYAAFKGIGDCGTTG